MPNLKEPFLLEKLNPLFLKGVEGFWNTLREAQSVDIDRVKATQKNLLMFILRRLFQVIYLKHRPKVKGSLYCVADVHTAGIGDYFALLKSAKTLQETHPEVTIHIAYTHVQDLPSIISSEYLLQDDCIHSFQEYPQERILEIVLSGRMVDYREESTERVQLLIQQGQHLYEQMKDSLALVHIALALNTFENPILAPKSLYFAETGNFQGIANYLTHNWFSMGLHPFEEGIFLRKSFPETPEWKDFSLPLYLWKNISDQTEGAKEYFKTHILSLGYFSKIPSQLLTYIYLICLQNQADGRDIDIITQKIVKEVIPLLNPHWLAKQGISKVIYVDLIQTDAEYVLLEMQQDSPKILRLIQALPTKDFEHLVALSSDVMGCTGDGSFSDCLIASKIPYYELPKHKIETWQACQGLATYLDLKDLSEYFQTIEEGLDKDAEAVATKLVQILSRQTFKPQMSKLLSFIKTYYCLEDSLNAHVNRTLWHGIHPHLKQKEEELVQNCLSDNLTFSDAFALFEKEISSGG